MKNLKSALISTYKLINTVMSPSFINSLDKPWVSKHPVSKVDAVKSKALIGMRVKIARELKYSNLPMCFKYLEALQSHFELSLTKSEQKGLVKGVTHSEYLEITELLYKASAELPRSSNLLSAQFECNELLTEIRDYLFIKDTIENGSGHAGLDRVIEKLFKTKAEKFFFGGYVTDLFVQDRLNCLKTELKITHIACYKDYLSTWSLKIAEADKFSDDRKLLLKLAA
jgi:hypothetical protein